MAKWAPELNDDNQPRHLTQAGITATINSLKVTPIELNSAVLAELRPHFDGFTNVHPLRGMLCNPKQPTVLLAAPKNATAEDLNPSQLRFFPWGWPGRYGASFTISVYAEGSSFNTRFCIDKADSLLDAFAHQPVRFILLRGQRPLVAVDVDFTANDETRRYVEAHIGAVKGYRGTVLDDPAVEFWEVIDCQMTFHPKLSPADLLSLGWYREFNRNAAGAKEWLEDVRKRSPFPGPSTKLIPPSIEDLLQVLNSPVCDVSTMLDFLSRRFSSTDNAQPGFVRDWFALDTKQNDAWEEFFYFLGHFFWLYNSSPEVSNCGTRLHWYDFLHDRHPKLDLLPHEFPNGCSPVEFWKRCHYDPLNYAWGSVIRGNDFPFDPHRLIESLNSLPQAEDVPAVAASADALLEEAIANKRGTIPRRAYVELAFGPFTHVEVTELDINVLFICRCEDDSFLQVIVEPGKNHCSFMMPGDETDGVSLDLKERVKAGVKLLFAAIVRDFWVIENRENVFDHRIERRAANSTRKDDSSPRVVYIPRILYSNRPNADRCTEQLNHEQRRSHFVRAHVRRTAAASKHQLVLAERYGISVPVGYTFVRPHERGKTARDVVYRSRSALQCIYVSTSSALGRSAEWFQFERDVHQLMENLGFSVQHISAARRGDGGVDVFATKGKDLDLVNWIIQCKCWNARRKIFPNSVRELIGTLADYPPGTRGMIVTTSAFSSGAIELAANHNIRLIDGDEFASRILTAANE